MVNTLRSRRGISLMEVLISMGILTIGLVSVISLIPAGRSQALKAAAIDRSTALAQNAAADFLTRGFARPGGWTANPSGVIAVFDPMDQSGIWNAILTGTYAIVPRVDAATSAVSASAVTGAGTAVSDLIMRGEDDIRYSTDSVGPDDPPGPVWSSSGTPGRHVFDGAYSYLVTLTGTGSTWNAGDYKTLSVVTFNRRDRTWATILSLSDTTSGIWNVDTSAVPSGVTLKDMIKPGGAVLTYTPGASPPFSWKRVLISADATNPNSPAAWRVGLTCEGGDVVTTSTANKVYVFPGAAGFLQMPIRLEGTSPWND